MKKRLTAIIVDDERLARNDLRSLLAENGECEIVGEADSVEKAVALIEEKDPGLVFLDIQMPGESGFDLLERVDLRARVIFVTAFDEYALKAFEVDAVDYLLKPVNPERLRLALEKIGRDDTEKKGKRWKLQYDDAMLLTINAHLKFLRISTIVSIEAAGDYSEITLEGGRKGVVQKSMQEWEERLPEQYFCRIHRSTIINIEHVARIDQWFGNSYHVYMKGSETPYVMSRRYAAQLKERMG